ncbi:MAG TPA: polyphosphate kinase 2 [Actinomycetota bacterium]|nr:polyphosphate kinase 2 [Actinomycetota bacterium]
MAKAGKGSKSDAQRYPRKVYEKELLRLQGELVTMSYWVRNAGARVLVLFEGRDAAGKGGTIKRITEFLSPRIARVAALPAPSERERGQWYFQRYVSELPAAGEIVLFDRSWYNRAGVETVMGFCTPEEQRAFLQQCPQFERLLVDDGIVLVKYWLSISDTEQERRFRDRASDPMRRWKLTPMDLNARTRFTDYSRAKDEMFVHTDTSWAPWFVVEADEKRRARLNCIAHLLTQIPYADTTPKAIKIPARQSDQGYVRPPRDIYNYVPDHASTVLEEAEGT